MCFVFTLTVYIFTATTRVPFYYYPYFTVEETETQKKSNNLPTVVELKSGRTGIPCPMSTFTTGTKNGWNGVDHTLCGIYCFRIGQESAARQKAYLVLCVNLTWHRQAAS